MAKLHTTLVRMKQGTLRGLEQPQWGAPRIASQDSKLRGAKPGEAFYYCSLGILNNLFPELWFCN